MIHRPLLIDDAQCVETVRALRWPDGVRCASGDYAEVTTQGCDDTQPARQRDWCKSCRRHYDDCTDTGCAGHHQALRVWMLCLSVLGLTLSHAHRAKALDLHQSDVQQMMAQLRHSMVARKPSPT